MGIVQSKLWDKVDKWGGRTIMHFFWERSRVKSCILWGRKVHNFMGSQHS